MAQSYVVGDGDEGVDEGLQGFMIYSYLSGTRAAPLASH